MDWKKRSIEMHRRAQRAEGRLDAAKSSLDIWRKVTGENGIASANMMRIILEDVSKETTRDLNCR